MKRYGKARSSETSADVMLLKVHLYFLSEAPRNSGKTARARGPSISLPSFRYHFPSLKKLWKLARNLFSPLHMVRDVQLLLTRRAQRRTSNYGPACGYFGRSSQDKASSGESLPPEGSEMGHFPSHRSTPLPFISLPSGLMETQGSRRAAL